MKKLAGISAQAVIGVLKKAGFEYAPKRGKGSHLAMVKCSIDGTRLVIIPDRKTIPTGTLRAILDQAGLRREEFFSLLNQG